MEAAAQERRWAEMAAAVEESVAAAGLRIGAVMTADTAMDILQGLAAYSARLGRQCEVVLRADGGGEIMADEEFTLRGEEPSGFEQVARFASIEELMRVLEDK
jgi:hypothetical protein